MRGLLLCGRRLDEGADQGSQPVKLLQVNRAEQGELLLAGAGQREAHNSPILAVLAVAGDQAELLGAIDQLHGAVVSGAKELRRVTAEKVEKMTTEAMELHPISRSYVPSTRLRPRRRPPAVLSG